MTELYGVLGTAEVPSEVIQASLNDVSTKVDYLIPWYGVKPIPSALIAVYDWMLDNEASYEIVVQREGTARCPKALQEGAQAIIVADDPSEEIVTRLTNRPVKGLALLMWNEQNPEESIDIATACIDAKLPCLELSNGLTPVIMEDDIEETKVELKDMPTIDPAEWDRETLDVMPASSVKKMAREAGHEVKTKAEAIDALQGTVAVATDKPLTIGSVIAVFNDGSEIGFDMTPEILNEIMAVVVKHQKG